MIWHSHLPHGNTRNSADTPRLAQYITMFPGPASAAEAGGRYASRGGDGGDTNTIAETAAKEAAARVAAWQKEDERAGVMGSVRRPFPSLRTRAGAGAGARARAGTASATASLPQPQSQAGPACPLA